MKLVQKIKRNEDGQVLVLVALLMVVLVGFAALMIDVGAMYLTKSNMQNAADAAAIAGAQKLPYVSTAISTAKDYAELNGAEKLKTTATAPYNGDSDMIEVVITKNVPFSFAKVLGFTQSDVTARAVAKRVPVWNGEALPFLNLDDNYSKDPKIEAWEKVGSGDFESILNDEYHPHNENDSTNFYYSIDYQNGITLKKGTVAVIKQEIGYIYEQGEPEILKPVTVYLFSLSSVAIESGKYIGKLPPDLVIPLKDLVLLQVTFNYYDYQGKTAYLGFLQEFDIYHGVYPTEFLNADSKGTSGLVE